MYVVMYINKFIKKCHHTPDYLILRVEIAMARKRFWHPLLTNKLATMTQSDQTTITLNHHMTLYARFSLKMQRQLSEIIPGGTIQSCIDVVTELTALCLS